MSKSLYDPANATDVLRLAIMAYVPDGYRDDHGIWVKGPLRAETLAALDTVEANRTQWHSAANEAEEERDDLRVALAAAQAELDTLLAVAQAARELEAHPWGRIPEWSHLKLLDALAAADASQAAAQREAAVPGETAGEGKSGQRTAQSVASADVPGTSPAQGWYTSTPEGRKEAFRDGS